jgi:zinc D-Ala-D-Ala carboxypeptidase
MGARPVNDIGEFRSVLFRLLGARHRQHAARPRWWPRSNAPLLEEVRRIRGGKPIQVTSGYRCPALNAAVGGVPDSAHLLGCAADFLCPTFGTPLQVCRAIAGYSPALDFDQVIHEHLAADWTHIAWSPDQR